MRWLLHAISAPQAGGGRAARQTGQDRKVAAVTSFVRVVASLHLPLENLHLPPKIDIRLALTTPGA